MKTSLLVVVALIGCAVAAPIPSSPSICDTYAVGGVNGFTVMNLIVNGTIDGIAQSGLKRFFDGSIPGTTNFFADAAALATLKKHLAEFFGQAALLNCTDGSVPAYEGNANMQAVHAKFPIQLADSILFNKILLGVANTAQVSAADQDRIRIMLSSVRYDICNTGNTCNPGSICDKYSIALNASNNGLVGAVVDGTVGKVTTDSLKRFFDGSIAGTTNFLDPNNKAALATLRDHLIQFFGQAGVLDCTDGSVAAYAGRGMKDAHAKLPIGIVDFNTFNQDLLAVMKGAGVLQVDLDATLKILETTKVDICNQADCGNPASTVVFSAFLLFAALFFTLF